MAGVSKFSSGGTTREPLLSALVMAPLPAAPG